MRGNVYGRLERLEGRVKPGTGVDTSRPMRADVVAVLNEYSAMRSRMSEKSYRGSPDGPVWIPPRDIAREHYGRDYTEKEFLELAIVRALEGLGFEGSEIDERMPELLAMFEELGRSREGGRGIAIG
jgi:hypothetical protein